MGWPLHSHLPLPLHLHLLLFLKCFFMNSKSFGFGYDFGGTLLSFSHKILKSNKNHSLFDSGLTDSAELMTKHSLSNISLIFKF